MEVWRRAVRTWLPARRCVLEYHVLRASFNVACKNGSSKCPNTLYPGGWTTQTLTHTSKCLPWCGGGRGGDVPREALWQVGALLGSMLCGAQSTRPFDGGPRASPNESEGMLASFEFVHASTPFSAEWDQWSALEGCQES